jgi:hypothetical protein
MTFSVLALSLVLVLVLVNAVAAYEDNETNVGVYSNHISSCNWNHNTDNMICINRDFESVIQFHGVALATFCPYHYCVTFENEVGKIACTGYVFSKISAGMGDGDSAAINPLTPDLSNDRFTGNPTDDYVNLRTSFEGNNIFIDRFEQSVETYFGDDIVEVQCKEPLTTCVSVAGGETTCFGGDGLTFHTFTESVVLGFFVPMSMAILIYLSLACVKWRCRLGCAYNSCVTMVAVPLTVEVLCALILFVAPDFIVKVGAFITASVIGIVAGKLIVDVLVKFLMPPTPKRSTRPSPERKGMLKKSSRVGDPRFHVGTDDDDEDELGSLAEIELGSVGASSTSVAKV